jgi:hypothetical protein
LYKPNPNIPGSNVCCFGRVTHASSGLANINSYANADFYADTHTASDGDASTNQHAYADDLPHS